MVVRRKIERLLGHRLLVEAETLSYSYADAETRAGRRPAIISKAIAGAYSSPCPEDGDSAQTGRVQHSEGDWSPSLRRGGETAATSRDEAS